MHKVVQYYNISTKWSDNMLSLSGPEMNVHADDLNLPFTKYRYVSICILYIFTTINICASFSEKLISLLIMFMTYSSFSTHREKEAL